MIKKYKLTKLGDVDKPAAQKDESSFLIDYRKLLNPAQFEAVTSEEGAYLLIAGAGTGKTRTLVFRVARLIELGYDPKSIVLLTFTRKAAKEMLNRASLLLDNRCSKISGGTFHSFANIILRKYAKAVGLESNFTILDQGDSEDVINLIRSQLNLSAVKKRFPHKQTLNKIYSLSVNTQKNVDSIVYDEYPHFYEFIEPILKIQTAFQNYKAKNFLLDYDDLLVNLNKFLLDRSPAALSFLKTINFVMVDEYQDTNKLQADTMLGLTQLNNNIMAVGDDSQSIYSFRGANFKNIMEFPSIFKDVKIIKLEENYRSVQNVLNFANHVIEAAIEKYPKHLYTKKPGGDLPAIITTQNENMQSKFIVDKILSLREENIPLGEMAVLFRSSYNSFDLEIELTKANLPFVKFGGMKFIETSHVKDVLAFLRISANPKDIVSWYRILLLHEGIGPKTAQKIIDEIAQENISIKINPEALVSLKANKTMINLFSLLHKIHTAEGLPSEKTELVLEYYDQLFKAKYDDYNKRKKDLDMFLNISQNYKSMDSFLSDMALDPPRDSVADIEAAEKENEFLTLSTIHSAKGLEWTSVFIIHAIEGFFPSSQSAQSLEQLEEERRLMYVASTRAKQHLFISYPMNIFSRENGMVFSKPSRFIEGLTDNLAETWLLEE